MTESKTEEIAEYLDIPVETVEDMAKPDPYDNDEYSRSYDDSGAFESDIEESYPKKIVNPPSWKKTYAPGRLTDKEVKDGDILARQKDSKKHDTGGFRISDADAKAAKGRLKKKYGKFARHFKELRVFKTNPITGTKTVTRAARKRQEELGKISDARIKATTTKQKGIENDLQEIRPDEPNRHPKKATDQAKIRDAKKRYSKAVGVMKGNTDEATKLKQSTKKPKQAPDEVTLMNGKVQEGQTIKGMAADLGKEGKASKADLAKTKKHLVKFPHLKNQISVKEEQKRVTESLANLVSRGIDHKPLPKKKVKSIPAKPSPSLHKKT